MVIVLALVVAAATASVLVLNLGERLRLPWPALMVVLGVGVAFVPGVPAIRIDPELILPLFLPPLLYTAALRTSVALFRSRWRSILTLAVALTAATIAAVAATATALVPGITVTAAVAVAAAVAPPDPVAVEAVAGPLRLPRRLLTVLQSEGLFNDAVTLVVFQAALAALAAGDGLGWGVGLRFVYGLVAAVVVGVGLAWLSSLLGNRTDDPAARAAVGLVLPFAVYLAADAVAASGVVAVVAAGLASVSYQDADDTSGRVTAGALWGVVEVVVTGLAFALVGAELRTVVTAAGADLPRILAHAGVVCAVVVGLRAVWMTIAVLVVRRRAGTDDAPRDWREAVVMTWSGMRGLATLALALALPTTVAGGAPFPGRTEAVVIACAVLVVTLLVPAFTLSVVLRVLGVAEDERARRAAESAVWQRARQAMRTVLMDHDVLGEDGDDRTRERLEQVVAVYEMLDEPDPGPERRQQIERARRGHERRDRLEAAMLLAARGAVLAARLEPGIDPAAADRVLRDLDAHGTSA